jgi:hypothetical protein
MRQRHRQTVLFVSFYLLAVSLRHCLSFVFAGLGKTICFVLFACLLMFLVVRSADICRSLTACLQALQLALFPLIPDLKRTRRSSISLVVPKEPSLSPFFQRPPPIFS